MKILIKHNSQAWATMKTKLDTVKNAFMFPVEFTVEQTNFTNIPHQTYLDSNGNQYQAVEANWYDSNISLPALKQGYDIVVFALPPEQWQGKQVQGLGTKANVGIQEICMLADENNPNYDFNGITYEGGQFVNILKHEICHRIYEMLAVSDLTHYYYNKRDLYTLFKALTEPKTNPLVQFYRDELNKPVMPTVYLIRMKDNGVQTLGNLTVGDTVFKTMERPWLDNKPNISAIPVGSYICKWNFSPRFMKYTYEITGVPKRSGIRIHSANYWSQLNGCTALGMGFADINKDGQTDVTSSKIAVDKFNKIMRGKPFRLIIK